MNSQKIERVRERMRALGVDALILGPGPDLTYLSGYVAHLSERLTALHLPLDSPETLYVPALEAPAARASGTGVQIVAWDEHQDPVRLVASALEQQSATHIGVGDQLWSRFLLRLQHTLPSARWSPASDVTAPVRLVKSSEEIDLLRRAGAAADRVWERVVQLPLTDLTERRVAVQIAELLEQEGLDGAAFNIVASGPHSASPHHTPGDRRLQSGDIVVMDYGGPLGGYHSDITRTLCIGRPTDDQRRVHAAVKEAQERGVRAVRPGAMASDVDSATRSCLEEVGLGDYFIHRTGHGLGLEVHEPPYIIAGNDERLREGMVFSVEPGAYIPGAFGIRIEDIVVVTVGGCERLNNASRELVAL